MTDAAKAFEYETAYLAGVESKLEEAKGTTLRGKLWVTSRLDDSDALRAMLASNRIFDRDRLKSLPANRRVTLRGFERRFFFGKRKTGVAIASVLTPLKSFAANPDDDGPPIDLGELTAHVRKLSGDAKVLHLIGVCSPTGFTESAKHVKIDLPNVTVVLIEPDGSGGWRTMVTGDSADDRVQALFDPEDAGDKIDRVMSMIQEKSADMVTGGVSAESIGRLADLPPEIVKQAFERVAEDDPELHVSDKGGELLLFRGAPVGRLEKKSMNVIERLRQLLSSDGDEAAKINLLAERRAALAQRRDRLYGDIGKLEQKEAGLRSEGKAAHTAGADVKKRRVAAQLVQLRKDIARQNATAAMLNKQIDIISTDIHNLTLIQQGDLAQLPDTEELTENAVKAEEMLEQLQADADIVGSLETGIEASLTSEEELAVLQEFEDTPATTQSAATEKAADKATDKPAVPNQASATSPVASPPAFQSPASIAPTANESEMDSTDTPPAPPEKTDRSADAEAS